MSDQDPKFTNAFWRHFSREVGMKLRFRTAFHSQTDGKTKCMNEVLKQYLRNLVGTIKEIGRTVWVEQSLVTM